MTAANRDAVDGRPVSTDIGGTLRGLWKSAVMYATGKASHQVEDWTDRLDDYVDSAGATDRAGIEGVFAYLLGKNPVWAAAKGAWLGASGKLRVAIVVSSVLLAVLSPVVLLLLLVGLLVAGIVAGVRVAARPSLSV